RLVFGQQQHLVVAERREPHLEDKQLGAAVPTWDLDLELAHLPVASHLPGEEGQGVNAQSIGPNEPVWQGGGTRADDPVPAADVQAAESVIASDVDIDERADALEETALNVIALQAPVAGELRTLVGALRISATLERMGDLAEHIARSARRRYPDHAVPAELHD